MERSHLDNHSYQDDSSLEHLSPDSCIHHLIHLLKTTSGVSEVNIYTEKMDVLFEDLESLSTLHLSACQRIAITEKVHSFINEGYSNLLTQ